MKNSLNFFLRLEAELFLALKPSPICQLTFVKVWFPDKVTGLWAFETQMPFQKYQGSAIVVRFVHIGKFEQAKMSMYLLKFYSKKDPIKIDVGIF